MADERTTGTARVKRGLAEMLRGGVIMDVVDAEQAKIAEDAGAVAVMALERVPSDIRRDGGVARMSDPSMIEGIQKAVTMPVMAKCRIGHFAEAQVLQALGVDYVDESEVLTPGRRGAPRRQVAFTVPFVCGATNLGEALRRIGEGACLIRTQGRGRHRQHRRGRAPPALDPRRHRDAQGRAARGALRAGRRSCARRSTSSRRSPSAASCRSRCSAPGGIATPADAALVMQLGAQSVFVGSGIFKSSDPVEARPRDRRGDHALRRRRHRRQGLARSGRGDARRGDRHARREARRAGLVTQRDAEAARMKVGVLALQGAFREHAEALDALGADVALVKRPEQLDERRRDRPAGRRVDHDRQAARLVGVCARRCATCCATACPRSRPARG